MGWFIGKYENDRDASDAATISDKDWRALQDRARKVNQQRAKFGTSEQVKGSKDGAANYDKRWWN